MSNKKKCFTYCEMEKIYKNENTRSNNLKFEKKNEQLYHETEGYYFIKQVNIVDCFIRHIKFWTLLIVEGMSVS